MLRIENPRKVNNSVCAELYFPDIEVHRTIVYDVKNKEVIELHCNVEEPEYVYGMGHLYRVLERMAEENSYPETFECFWY